MSPLTVHRWIIVEYRIYKQFKLLLLIETLYKEIVHFTNNFLLKYLVFHTSVSARQERNVENNIGVFSCTRLLQTKVKMSVLCNL